MTDAVPTMLSHMSIGEVQQHLRAHIDAYETIDYLYVVDTERRLLGVLSVRDLFRAPADATVGSIATRGALVTAGPDMSQEQAAHRALDHGIKALPVVDDLGRLLGVLPNDAILAITRREAREDMLHIAGIHPSHAGLDNILSIPLGRALLHRLPWLLMGLLGGIFAARIIGQYEATLERNLILAAFIPLIVYMSDAVGTQMEAFAIRDLSIIRDLNFSRYFAKQFSIVAIIALIASGVLIVLSVVLYDDLRIAIVLGVALSFAIISSVFTGLLIPFFFSRLRFDPANASGPVATIIQDIVSVVIYFSVASWLL